MRFKGWRRTIETSIIEAFILALFVFFPGSVHAQQATGLFGEVIEVRVLDLELVVTDENGERVTGLGPHDFVVTVDGKPVAIEYSSEIREGHRLGSPRSSALEEAPARRTSFLVFIDDVFPLGGDRNLALDHLIAQLPSLGQTDRMAVIAFDGRELEMLAGWTRNVDELRGVFEGAKHRDAHGLEEMALKKALAGTNERALYHKQRERSERVTLAAASTMRSFPDPEGRQVMMILSGGWPSEYVDGWPGDFYDSFAVSHTLASLPEALGYKDLYRPVVDTANLLGYTLYTVDARAFRGHTFRVWSENATLSRLARETGGLAFLNRGNRDALAATVADTRSYYSLGFTPRWKGEDRRHHLGVRAVRPGLRVRTRRNFTDLSRQTEVTMVVESALLSGPRPRPHRSSSGGPRRTTAVRDFERPSCRSRSRSPSMV